MSTQLPAFENKSFPAFFKEINGNVQIYWFQDEFEQNKYPPGQQNSGACTLICLLVAQKISQDDFKIKDPECRLFHKLLAEAILEGNCIHSHIVKKKLVKHYYLDTEEALKFGGKKLATLVEWKFKVCHDDLSTSLHKNMKSFLCQWYKCPESHNLFMLLITCGRTIVFIFQQKLKKVTLFDSHGHDNSRFSHRGLVVAQAHFQHLEELCNWCHDDIIVGCYDLQADQYELACLYHQEEQVRDGFCCECGRYKLR